MKYPEPIVVIGGGAAGVQLLRELQRVSPEQEIVIYNQEGHLPYYRHRLQHIVAGQIGSDELHIPLEGLESRRLTWKQHCTVVSIDREQHFVVDSNGDTQAYSRLVMATGTRPHIPNIPGIDKQGIFTLHELDNAQAVLARQLKSRRTIILGGGSLGMELAQAMQRYKTEVIVIDHLPRLMSRYLDSAASSLLSAMTYKQGIRQILGYPVSKFEGDRAVTGVSLRNGKHIPCDTVVIACGIQADISLARSAGLKIANGIRVDEFGMTSDPHIYAIGACAESTYKSYSAGAGGIEQARAIARNIMGQRVAIKPLIAMIRLKVAGQLVMSMGQVDEELMDKNFHEIVRYDRPDLNIYRKLVFKRNRLVGAVAVGDWHETERLERAINKRQWIFPWHKRYFAQRGYLWSAAKQQTESGAVVTKSASVGDSRLLGRSYGIALLFMALVLPVLSTASAQSLPENNIPSLWQDDNSTFTYLQATTGREIS